MLARLLKYLLSLIAAFVLLLAVIIGIAHQQEMVSKSDMEFLVELGKRDGLAAVVSVIRTELFGIDESMAADPSYGREQAPGRGYAPWVIRGNLDGHPRLIKFALRPDLWAAYHVESVSPYLVWKGSILFEGAAYDYKHGPQPVSQGEWYLRNEGPARWFLQVDGQELAAALTYLGHEYAEDKAIARMRFAVTAGDHTLEMTETPEIIDGASAPVFTRTFERVSGAGNVTAGFYDGAGQRFEATGTIEHALADAQAIEKAGQVDRGRNAEDDELSLGESVVANSDCLGCHAAHHRVTGPAWSEISGKFRAKLQDSVIDKLTQNLIRGSVGTWGNIPMPPHPDLSEDEARAAVVYILNTGEPEEVANPPLDSKGQPYTASYGYDNLPRPDSLHPSFTVEDIAPEGFEPKVGGMVFRDDGKLLVATWDTDGAVYLIDPAAPMDPRVQRIAEGLHEPLGMALQGERLFVLQKQELTELLDTDGDGMIDRYRAASYDWEANPNFHSFAFGLVNRDDDFYFLLSICVLPGGASCPEQELSQGKLLRVGPDGKATVFASGFRTPNGISEGPDGEIVVTDNQGDWLPSSKLVVVRDGDFYGSRVVLDEGVMDVVEVPPAVWLPQDEVGNSPTQSLPLVEGPYAGQLVHGDVYNGGLKRVFLEDIDGRPQGAVFHFSAGFKGGINRMARGPDGAIYLGEIGNPPNWGEYGKAWFGLERMQWAGNNAFEMLAVRATATGFDIALTQPLANDIKLSPADLLVKQWFYYPNEQYGGPKYNETELTVSGLNVSDDRRQISATIPGLRPGNVVYLRLAERLRSESGQSPWTAEAWYTLNTIPGWTGEPAQADGEWRDIFDGETLSGWRNYGGDENQVKKWRVENGTLTLAQEGAVPAWDMISSVVFGGGSGDLIYYREKFRDFELSLEWKISEGGNSGIFYYVADETENTPWLTGIEMQVLHNEGHKDGKIDTHRAGDLYDLIAADPVTVRPPGEWNEVLIRVRDNHIEHWLNGEKVVAVERWSQQWNDLVAASKFADMPGFGKAESGYIVLQDHGDPVWYRNIRVRTLTPSR
ncbi:MAG: family 16 glycoside hydrolase [Halioglobus sp.]